MSLNEKGAYPLGVYDNIQNIQSKRYIQREREKNNQLVSSKTKNIMFTIVGYCEKLDSQITQSGALD